MKPETVRRQIVDYTKQEMILHGVSRLTMDLIAQGMGMSKRTLYQLFPSKVCLVRICLAELAAEKHNQLLTGQKQEEYSCTEILFRTMDVYTSLIHYQGSTLLSDLAGDPDYQPMMEREKTFWLQQLADALNLCKACGVLVLMSIPTVWRWKYSLSFMRTVCVALPMPRNGCLLIRCCVDSLKWMISAILTSACR